MSLFRQVIAGLAGLAAGFALYYFLQRFVFRRPSKAPSSRSITRTIFYDADTKQHYRFEPVPHVCPPSIDIDALEHSSEEDLIGDETAE